MSAWIMSQLITERPRTFHYFIGELEVASIRFIDGDAVLCTKEDVEPFPSMSLALKEMHRRLRSPPPDGAITRADRDAMHRGIDPAPGDMVQRDNTRANNAPHKQETP